MLSRKNKSDRLRESITSGWRMYVGERDVTKKRKSQRLSGDSTIEKLDKEKREGYYAERGLRLSSGRK